MADQSDVEDALVAAVSAALYPHGTTEASVPGPDCRVYRGWPNSAALDADLAAGKVNVTVFPGTSPGRTTTRYPQRWMGEPKQPALTATVAGTSVTFDGAADTGQIAGILANGISYVYRTKMGDTPELVAANLAAMVRSDAIVQLSQRTLTIAGAKRLVARVVADAQVQREARRQEQSFRITCWCPTPGIRDTTAAVIDRSLEGTRFIALPDETYGRLSYLGTTVFDQSQNANLYRRDIDYTVEYPTILTADCPAMLFGNLILNRTSTTT